MQAIETNGLTKYYSGGKVQALENFSLAVSKGKIFSLLGPNGAGKTTLIKLLLGIVHPTRGNAQILGKDISNYRVHRQVGYLPENHRFPDFLNAAKVLFLYGRMSGVSKSLLKERIPSLLNLVKLTGWEKTRIRKYSKGMLQRLGIAQALINDPDILFLDEPTDGIDPIGRREIRDLLLSLRDRGKTIFLNSHLLSEVERVSDQVAILNKGRLLRQGNVQDFISLKDQYELKAVSENKRVPRACQQLGIPLKEQNGQYLISVNHTQQLNQLIDKLRKEQIIIQGIIPRKMSLEDYFIEVLEEKSGESL